METKAIDSGVELSQREVEIDLSVIDISDPNMRTDVEASPEQNEELTESIRAHHGVLQPIGVYRSGDRFKLIYGQRRLFCSRKAGEKKIRATVFPAPKDLAELLMIQTQENGHRVDVEPVQFGETLKKIKELRGWTSEQVAKGIGFNSVKVSRLLKLAEQPDAIKQLVKSGTAGVTTALELGKFSEEDQRSLIGQVQSGAVTRDQLIGLRKSKRKSKASASNKSSRITAVLETGRSVTVCSEGLTLETFISTLEDLLSRARRARPTGVELKTFLAMLKDQSRTA